MKIEKIHASTALASLGDETVRVEMTLENGLTSIALVPAGLSAGKYESARVPAREAVKQITENTAQFLNQEWTQQTLDNQLVELPLAGNSTLAVSAAFWKATQQIKLPHDPSDLKFPQLLVLLFEGAKHGNPKITFQEFLLVEDSVHQAITDFQKMRDYLCQQRGENATVGAEGGFSPSDFDNIKCLNTIKKVFPQKSIALDCAGSFESHGAENYQVLLDNYKIFSIEDPYSDEEWLKWQELYKNCSAKILIVGDDLTATNPLRIQQAINTKSINAVIIKPNQNGTISGTIQAVAIARKNGLKIIVSHRGEETSDDWIVDFAVKEQADYVKFGGLDRGERIAKYNRLLDLGMR